MIESLCSVLVGAVIIAASIAAIVMIAGYIGEWEDNNEMWDVKGWNYDK